LEGKELDVLKEMRRKEWGRGWKMDEVLFSQDYLLAHLNRLIEGDAVLIDNECILFGNHDT